VELVARDSAPGALDPIGERGEADPGAFGKRLDNLDQCAAQLDGVSELVAVWKTGVRQLEPGSVAHVGTQQTTGQSWRIVEQAAECRPRHKSPVSLVGEDPGALGQMQQQEPAG